MANSGDFSGPGETLSIAEEMAARDSLRNFWGTADDRQPLAFGEKGRTLDLEDWKKRTNGSLSLLCESDQSQRDSKTEPLDYAEMMMKYKEDIEPRYGPPYRKRHHHKFYWGSKNRKWQRKWHKPLPARI